jgi:hypothetical protein
MRRLASCARVLAPALALAVALALQAPAGGAGGVLPADAAAAKAKKKKCSKKHKRAAIAGKKKRHCKRPAAGNGPGSEGGKAEVPCPNTPSSPGRVSARETEFQIVLSRPSVGCGTSIVEQNNAGEDPHDLVLQKAGASATHVFPELGPGLVARRTLDLGRGTWTLYCSLPGHLEAGMRANLEVQ